MVCRITLYIVNGWGMVSRLTILALNCTA